MTDQFNVTATFSQPTGYVAGQTMKVTISGSAVNTTTATETVQVTISLLAADGSTGTTTVSIPVSKTAPTTESVTIASVTDSDGRKWTVDASGLFATAIA